MPTANDIRIDDLDQRQPGLLSGNWRERGLIHGPVDRNGLGGFQTLSDAAERTDWDFDDEYA